MQDFKITFSEPRDFDIARLVAGMGKSAQDFTYHQRDGKISLSYNDVFGTYRQKMFFSGGQSDRYNWVDYLSFELNDAGRVTAIKPGHPSINHLDILFRIKDLDRNSPEYKLVKDYTDQMYVQTMQYVDRLQEGSQIEYSRARQANAGVVAGVFQGSYATAHGPQVEVGFLGTYGIGPCIGVAVVTKIEGEDFPRVSLAHVDAMTEVDNSISRLLYGNKYKDGKTEVYLVSGQRSDGDIVKVARALSGHGINPKYDLDSFGSKTLVVDLATGTPVEPSSMGAISWLEPEKSRMDIMFQLAGMKMMKTALSMQFDLTRGIPQGYEINKLSGRPFGMDAGLGSFDAFKIRPPR